MAALHIGVIIGRFQVPQLHDGHLRLFKEVEAKTDLIVVLLGISPMDGYTAENPLTFNQRQHIVQASWGKSFLKNTTSGIAIFPLPDQRTNEEWSDQIDTLLRSAYPTDRITLFGGRDSFVDSYCGKHQVEHLAFCPPLLVAGTINRAAIKESNTTDFYAGQIYALQRQFPHAYPTVDVALIRNQNAERAKATGDEAGAFDTLLIQRADSGRWCFPGGFVDPTDDSMEAAGQRELYEEVGLVSESPLKYLGSFRVNDFRYRGSRDKIVTTFFMGRHAWGAPVMNPTEVQDYKWIAVMGPALLETISDIHRPLAVALQKWLSQ